MKPLYFIVIPLVLLQTISFSFGLQSVSGADPTLRTCEPIRVTLCHNLGYNATGMPNLIGHELQSDADFTLQTFSPLIQYGCSAQLHFFLCSVYVPMCNEKVPKAIGPCRGLCETVRARCYPVLQGFGFPWPTALDCQNFPKENNHEHMCMEGPGERGAAPPPRNPSTVQQGTTCQRAKPHLYAFLNRSNRCAPICGSDILFDSHDKHLAEVWSGSWSVLCFTATTVALLTFVIAPEGSRAFGERALWPLCLCHWVQAVGWGVRALAGRDAVSCGPDSQAPGQILLLTDGLSNANCAVVFLLLYYFGMAAAVWYAVLCWSWFRSVRPPKSASHAPVGGPTAPSTQELQTTSSTVLQLIAWGLPAMQTVAVLVARLVDADELTGACFVGNQSTRSLLLLVACPLAVYLLVGVALLIAGSLSIQRKKSPLPLADNRPTKSNTRLAWCAAVYTIPCACVVISYFYETIRRDEWLAAPKPSSEPSVPPRAPLWVFLLRVFMSLICGVIVSVWALTPKTLGAWRRIFGGISPAYKPAPLKCTSPPISAHYYAPAIVNMKQPQVQRSRRIKPHHTNIHRKPRSMSHSHSIGGETML